MEKMSAEVDKQEDEGYPEDEEDFFHHFVSNPDPSSSIVGATLSKRTFLNEGQSHDSCSHCNEPSTSNGVQEQDEESEKIKILSWDKIQIPIPFRFQRNHVQLVKVNSNNLQSGHNSNDFLLDSFINSKMCVDLSWSLRDISPAPPSKSSFSQTISSVKQVPPVFISPKQFIESVLHLLAGRGSVVFPMINQNDAGIHEYFRKNPKILVHGISPSALDNLSKPFIVCGNIVKELNKVCDCCNDNVAAAATIVDIAFIKFTSNYVKIFQTVLMLNFNKIQSFTQLLAFVRPFRQQLELLYKIWFGSSFPHDSSTFSSSMNCLLLSERCPIACAVIRNVFVSCASAYLRHISDWMFRGQLPSSSPSSASEFFVTKVRENPYRDRRFWSKQFACSCSERDVPAFLRECLKTVFETGKAVNFLKQIQKETSFSSWSSSLPYLMISAVEDLHHGNHLQLVPIASFEDLEKLHCEWNDILKKFMAAPTARRDALVVEIPPPSKSKDSHMHDLRLDPDESSKDDLEEKLDPNKLLTTLPPLYNTAHIQLVTTQLFEEIKQGTNSSSPQPPCTKSTQQRESTNNVHSLHLFLSQGVSLPAQIQCTMVNRDLLRYFIHEQKLLHHVSALNNFLCLQNGLFGHRLTELLLREVDSTNKLPSSPDDISCRIGSLNAILADAIVTGECEELSSNLAFSFNPDVDTHRGGGDSKPLVSSPYQDLNSIKLVYAVNWPLNVILTGELLGYFERVFLLQMRLLRVELLLQEVFLGFKPTNERKRGVPKSPQSFRLHSYRCRLVHFVRTIRNYINVTVIQVAWAEWSASWEKMDSLDKIYDSLVRHIKSIHTNCLLGTKAEGVMKLLTNQLVIIETFCSQLQNSFSLDSEEIPEQTFKKLIQKFKAVEEIGKVFVEVAYKLVHRGYYPKVSYFLELYNFNGFFTRTKNKEVEA